MRYEASFVFSITMLLKKNTHTEDTGEDGEGTNS
jgi:hypothetical protein